MGAKRFLHGDGLCRDIPQYKRKGEAGAIAASFVSMHPLYPHSRFSGFHQGGATTKTLAKSSKVGDVETFLISSSLGKFPAILTTLSKAAAIIHSSSGQDRPNPFSGGSMELCPESGPESN